MPNYTTYSILAETLGSSAQRGILIAIVLVLLLGILIRWWYTSKSSSQGSSIPELQPSFFFWLGMFYLGVLLIGAILYHTLPAFNQLFPNQLIGGMLPVAVPWFGALGAVMISLQGVFYYNDKWDSKLNYWHIARPVFGAVLGIVAFYFFVLLTMASGTEVGFLKSGTPNAKPSEMVIYYVLAFLVGYREETFRELITRVTDVIFKPGGAPPTAPSVMLKVDGVVQPVIDFGDVPQNTSVTKTIEIHNSGSATLLQSAVQASPDEFAVDSASLTAAVDLASASKRKVDVTFTPTAAKSYSGSLTVNGTNLSPARSIPLKGRGT